MKSVLITGAFGGMGKAAAELLKNCGYRVFALDISIGDEQENIIPIKADITSPESVRSAYEKVSSLTDSLYAIIHFAGIYMLDSLAEMSPESFDRIFNINLKGVFLINKFFLPLLKKDSRIVITTSELATLDPLPFTGIYAVSKSALDKYAFSLRMELQLLSIKVSVLRAGAVNTGMLGVSTKALDNFCNNTQLYSCNAKRFRSIVNRVEARSVQPLKIAEKVSRILQKRNPAFAYSVNRNPLLLLLGALPARLQFAVISRILR